MNCQWFALCPNTTTKTVRHPILGEVPVCEECAAWLDRQTNRPK